MNYVVVKTESDTSFDYASRNEALGILGTINLPSTLLHTTDSLEDAKLNAYAHVGRFPSHSLYIANRDGHVFEIVSNQQYHDHVSLTTKSLFIAWACFSFSLIGLIGASFGRIGLAAPVFSFTGIAVYLLSVKTGTFNEVESLVVSVIIAALTTMLIPALIPAL